jgi:hypothetical protein
VDVFHPSTGEVRSDGADGIACWFIDTDYNGESFFVRHAYFTGADEPYEKLKRALRADIDESAWSALYSTVSRPFPKPRATSAGVRPPRLACNPRFNLRARAGRDTRSACAMRGKLMFQCTCPRGARRPSLRPTLASGKRIAEQFPNNGHPPVT